MAELQSIVAKFYRLVVLSEIGPSLVAALASGFMERRSSRGCAMYLFVYSENEHGPPDLLITGRGW